MTTPVDLRAQALAEYSANAGYAEARSLESCRRFITACTQLIALTPTNSMANGVQVEFDPTLLAEQQRIALRWANAFELALSGHTLLDPWGVL